VCRVPPLPFALLTAWTLALGKDKVLYRGKISVHPTARNPLIFDHSQDGKGGATDENGDSSGPPVDG
jgi:hypothetical protein